MRYTVVLAALAVGSKLPPLLIFLLKAPEANWGPLSDLNTFGIPFLPKIDLRCSMTELDVVASSFAISGYLER